jgi:tRNA modification GTPase
MSDTIFAQSTPAIKSAVAIFRVSGPRARDVGQILTGKDLRPRVAHLVELRRPESQELLDVGLGIFFSGPASFTGEDVLELHTHGGAAICRELIDELGKILGLRLAEPGEFTRRAFLNDKVDIGSVEALADLIDADTRHQHRQAIHRMVGGFIDQFEEWRNKLLQIRSLIEASLDFSDEGDLRHDLEAEACGELKVLRATIGESIRSTERYRSIRNGFNILIAGPPNAGKSTLMNALGKRRVSIVSDMPGTTRDLVEVKVEIDGYPIVFIDSAGIRETDDRVEREGVNLALERSLTCDLILWLGDDSGLDDFREATAEIFKISAKCDVLPFQADRLNISAVTGEGMDDLLAAILGKAKVFLGDGECRSVLHARQLLAARSIDRSLQTAIDNLDLGFSELCAEELLNAGSHFSLVGEEITQDNVLDEIFARFCLGK